MNGRPNLVLAATILASGLAFIDGSVVNVALPALGAALHADAASLQWVINAYLLPLSALLLAGGAAGDRWGRRRLLVAGTALFAAASLACALAPGLPVLLLGRFGQGVGAAMLMPNSLAILGATFPGPAKGRAVGIWAATGAALGAAGPVIGGALIDGVGWRTIFLLNLPVAAGAVVLALRAVPPDEPGAAGPLDGAGAALATAGLGLLTAALTEGTGPGGWTRWSTAGTGAAVALLAAFLLVERRRGDAAMMPLGLFGSARLAGLSLLTLLLYGALGGLAVLLPFDLMEASGYSGTRAGAALLPLPLVLAAMSPWVGALAGRVGPRLPLAAGAFTVAAGCLLALRIGPAGAYWTEVLPALLVLAVGLGLAVAPLTTAVLNAVDARHTGSASGLNSALARTGGMVATALLGTVLAERGAALNAAFHDAALAGAGICAAAGLSAWLLIGRA